jgi:hypothetical protein
MPNHNTVSSERLDGRDSLRAQQPLKTIQRALAFEHQAHNGALRLISSHRLRT